MTTYTNALYQQNGQILVDIDGITHYIPVDNGNRDYYNLMQWVAADPQNNIIAPYVVPAPTSVDVNTERDRRVLVGNTFTLTGLTETVHLSGDSDTRDNLQALVTVSNILLASGDTTTLTPYRDADNITHSLTQRQVVELFIKSAAYISQIYVKSWAIKALPTIPTNFFYDSFWV